MKIKGAENLDYISLETFMYDNSEDLLNNQLDESKIRDLISIVSYLREFTEYKIKYEFEQMHYCITYSLYPDNIYCNNDPESG